MKKLLIVLMSFALLASCKSKENSKENKTENKAKDDYQDQNDNKENKEKFNSTTDDLDEDGNSKADVESINGQDDSEVKSWPQSERSAFVSSCVREAVKGGRSQMVAQSYCDCMLEKMEAMYPDINVAARLTENEVSSVMTKYAAGCLSEN